MIRTATIAFDGLCRLDLARVWNPALPVAAWLLMNPSEADAERDDNTVRRMIRFSAQARCGGLIAVNYRPWRTPYPAALWEAIKRGQITDEMMIANDRAIVAASAKASVHFIATGVEAPRRDRVAFDRALHHFDKHRPLLSIPKLCLGTSPDGWPLHPLARGKFAIPNTREPVAWSYPE